MTAATLNFLKSIPAAPRVALLPDHRFFVRQVPVVAGATAAEVASQIELALEGLSPFPPAQLYHGYYWVPGAGYALVFATYRKRFTTDETAEWSAAELLVPAFVGVFGLEHEPATTVIYTGADSLTAVHWEEGEVPSTVVIREIMAEATEEERAKVREEMLRGLGGSRKVIDLVAPPEPVSSSDEQDFLFQVGEFTARLPVAAVAALDVRDKDELTARRMARTRDLILWRVFVGCATMLVLLLVGEIALLAGRQIWFKAMSGQIAAQRPVVEKIMTAHELATHIDRLSSERLLPFEMIKLVNLVDKRGGIYFNRMTTTGRYSLLMNGQTNNPGDLDVYRVALKDLPAVADLKIERNEARNGIATFTWEITFKPEALQPAN